jgi:hypothetical protein
MDLSRNDRGLTKKGVAIAAYILERKMPDAGRGFMVMGASIGRDGRAIENTCFASCPREGCTAHPGVVDHGMVTLPGRIDRFREASLGGVKLHEKVRLVRYGEPMEGIVVDLNRSFLNSGTVVVYLLGQHIVASFSALGHGLTPTGEAGDIEAARAEYRAHLSQYPAWRSQFEAGYVLEW